jgi:hypothetical protein
MKRLFVFIAGLAIILSFLVPVALPQEASHTGPQSGMGLQNGPIHSPSVVNDGLPSHQNGPVFGSKVARYYAMLPDVTGNAVQSRQYAKGNSYQCTGVVGPVPC